MGPFTRMALTGGVLAGMAPFATRERGNPAYGESTVGSMAGNFAWGAGLYGAGRYGTRFAGAFGGFSRNNLSTGMRAGARSARNLFRADIGAAGSILKSNKGWNLIKALSRI